MPTCQMQNTWVGANFDEYSSPQKPQKPYLNFSVFNVQLISKFMAGMLVNSI